MAIVSQVRTFIDMHQVVCAGPFIYAYVEEVSYSIIVDLLLLINSN